MLLMSEVSNVVFAAVYRVMLLMSEVLKVVFADFQAKKKFWKAETWCFSSMMCILKHVRGVEG